jgi:hypothetical protein
MLFLSACGNPWDLVLDACAHEIHVLQGRQTL